MERSQEKITIWINRDDTDLQGWEALRPVLERLEKSFLPRPRTLEVTGLSDRPVKGYLDDAVKKALDRRKYSVVLLGDDFRVGIVQLRNRTSVGVDFLPGPSAQEIRNLFLDLIRLIKPTYARAHFAGHAQELFEKHYKENERSFYANGLYWLNFFGPEEDARQGKGLAQNPHARAERLPEGLLMEVGSSPEEAVTPEGERRLLAATAALPPLPQVDETPATQPEPEPAKTTTIGGVRGFFDKVDHSFWVTKHLGPSDRLDTKTVAKLRGLMGQGQPAIKTVHVLFSDRDTALSNRDNLTHAGIRVWYVDPETGQPTES